MAFPWGICEENRPQLLCALSPGWLKSLSDVNKTWGNFFFLGIKFLDNQCYWKEMTTIWQMLSIHLFICMQNLFRNTMWATLSFVLLLQWQVYYSTCAITFAWPVLRPQYKAGQTRLPCPHRVPESFSRALPEAPVDVAGYLHRERHSVCKKNVDQQNNIIMGYSPKYKMNIYESILIYI